MIFKQAKRRPHSFMHTHDCQSSKASLKFSCQPSKQIPSPVPPAGDIELNTLREKKYHLFRQPCMITKLMTNILTIFGRCPKILPMLPRSSYERFRTFPKITEDLRSLPKTSDSKMFGL